MFRNRSKDPSPREIIQRALAKHKKPKPEKRRPVAVNALRFTQFNVLVRPSCTCGWKDSNTTVGRAWAEQSWGLHHRRATINGTVT